MVSPTPCAYRLEATLISIALRLLEQHSVCVPRQPNARVPRTGIMSCVTRYMDIFTYMDMLYVMWQDIFTYMDMLTYMT